MQLKYSARSALQIFGMNSISWAHINLKKMPTFFNKIYRNISSVIDNAALALSWREFLIFFWKNMRILAMARNTCADCLENSNVVHSFEKPRYSKFGEIELPSEHCESL